MVRATTYIGRLTDQYRLISCPSIGLWDGFAVGASVACGWCGRGTNAQPSFYINNVRARGVVLAGRSKRAEFLYRYMGAWVELYKDGEESCIAL